MVVKWRRRVLFDGLRACSHGRLEIEDSQAGMHFVAWLAGRSDAEAAALIEHARRARLGLYATTPLHLRPHDRVGLVLGYGGMSVAETEQALVVFERCLDDVFPVSAPPIGGASWRDGALQYVYNSVFPHAVKKTNKP